MRSEINTPSFKTSGEFWVSFSIFVPENYITISPTITIYNNNDNESLLQYIDVGVGKQKLN